MRVALVHDYLLRLGGAERVLKTFTELFPQAPIFTLLYDKNRTGDLFPAEKVITSRLQKLPSLVRKRYRYLLPLFPRYIESWDFSNYDLVISSSTAFAHGIITRPTTKHICYMHSPVRYLWDWTHEYQQEHSLSGIRKIATRRIFEKLRMWDLTASSRADLLIANSQHVRKRIKKYYRTDAEVLYPPVDTERFAMTSAHEDFFLIVSTLSPYKKVDLAVELFNKMGKKLVIIGEGAHRPALQQMAKGNITFLGWQSDEVVKDYMQRCQGLIFPGEEDFGITPVEAMACGKPVLAYEKGGVLESVLEEQTGAFFSEPTVSSMEKGLSKLLSMQLDRTKMRSRADFFSKKSFETQFMRYVDAVIAEKTSP